MRILLSGATGFIGRAVTERLAAGHELYGLTRREPPAAIASSAEWIDADLGDGLPAGLPRSVDAVIHLAQSDRYKDFPDGAGDVYAVNIASTFELLEYARAAGARSFVFTSSGGVYSFSFERLVETDPVDPLNLYLSSKYAAELLVGSYRSVFSTVVFRPFFVYGPGQTGMLISTFAERVLGGERITIEGSPGLRINPLFVDDAARAFEPALELEESGLFNLAGNEGVTLTELVELIADAAGVAPVVEHRGPQPAGDLIGDNSRMREVLGVEPRVTLGEGLKRVVDSVAPPSEQP